LTGDGDNQMANRRTYQFSGNNVAGVTRIFAKVTIGASGAPTLVTTGVHGNNGYITAIARNSAGDYTVTLADAWNALLGMTIRTINATGVSAAPSVNIKSNAVTTKSLGFVCASGATPTDPASGDILLLEFLLKNSSI
jgi:hypothetical protein